MVESDISAPLRRFQISYRRKGAGFEVGRLWVHARTSAAARAKAILNPNVASILDVSDTAAPPAESPPTTVS